MKILFVDIETSPNTAHVWGLWQQNVSLNQLMESSYTLCWAAKWYKNKDLEFASIPHDGEDNMIEALWTLLDEADVVVHYNGTKFDIPTINKEFLLRGYTPPAPYKQLDLLRICRRQFRFPSNKLDYVTQHLGLGGKTKHEGHELWVKCMNDDPVAWAKMEKYNKQDVKLLEKLYDRLLPWIDTHPNHALYTSTKAPTCPTCGGTKLQKRGTTITKTQQYQRYSCTGCGSWVRGRFTMVDKKDRENILVQEKI